MKYLIILIYFPMLFGLSKNSTKQNFSHSIFDQDTIALEVFFDYEVVEHYYNKYDQRDSANRFDWQDDTEKGKWKRSILFDLTPSSLQDTVFVQYLLKSGFKMKYMKPTKFRALNEVFSVKEYDSTRLSVIRCEPIFRDILIFKKDNSIVGVAKICFTCQTILLIGCNPLFPYFGQKGEYEVLKQLLHDK
jgi:hypothetical protein